jgi:hypothetical protein
MIADRSKILHSDLTKINGGKMKRILFVFAVLSITFLDSFSQLQTQDYYPLKVGYSWVYQHYNLSTGKESNWVDRYTVIEFDKQYNAYLVRWVMKFGEAGPRTTEIGIDKRKNYILEIGSRSSGGFFDHEWESYRETIMKLPLKVGASWFVKKSKDEDEKCTVIGKGNVMVNGIMYYDVFEIERVTSVKIEGGSEIVFYDFYAPNVGLVKKDARIDGKKIPFQVLTEFNKGL